MSDDRKNEIQKGICMQRNKIKINVGGPKKTTGTDAGLPPPRTNKKIQAPPPNTNKSRPATVQMSQN